MASPIWGTPPTIEQQGASLVVTSNASWFTQDGGDKIRRFVHVWFWNDTNVFGVPPPPLRTKPEQVQPGENNARLPLGPANIGGSFHIVEFGGFEGAEHDDGAWVEWGREQSSRPGVETLARSNTVVVQDWGATPPPTGGPTAATTRSRMIAEANLWQVGQSAPTPLARITVASDVLATTDAKWNAIRAEIRKLLGS